eukprot:TRINITY_DN15989_c0_g1_i1.p1 TRINITY_DN15989_c0_g1~~TRINITY_DN15989_c0_g1_i1.p1  ORF type:complete len:351 (+),score=69.11 TRINITY_DN15989_c0_g1_i1:52-1104(+)
MRSRTRSRSPRRRDDKLSTEFRIKRVKKVLETDAFEEQATNVSSTFELVIAMEELQEATLNNNISKEVRHDLFCVIIEKAVKYYSKSIILEVLAFIDRFYRVERVRSLDRAVHDYLTVVTSNPTPTGIRRLIRKILEGKTDVYDNMFSSPIGSVSLGRSESWVNYNPTIKEQVATLVQWIDSRCSNISMSDATARVRHIFEGDEATTTESMKVQLSCPLSTTRIVIPACSKDHLQPFDLEHFLYVNLQRNETQPEGSDPIPWKCPVSSNPLDKDSILIDHYFADILAKVGPNVESVTVSKDGSWKEDVASPLPTSLTINCIDVPDGSFLPEFDIVVKNEDQASSNPPDDS